MPVGLLDADDDIMALIVGVLRFVDGQLHGLGLARAMADHPAFLIHHIPAVQRVIAIDMNRMLRTGLGAHDGVSAPAVPC